jgi:transketolase
MVAADRLLSAGITSSVYSVHSLQPVEPDRFVQAARSHAAIVTVEDHTVNGGLGGLILETLADQQALPGKFLRMGLNRCFSSVVGSQTYLRTVYGLDASSIVSGVQKLLRT